MRIFTLWESKVSPSILPILTVYIWHAALIPIPGHRMGQSSGRMIVAGHSSGQMCHSKWVVMKMAAATERECPSSPMTETSFIWVHVMQDYGKAPTGQLHGA